MANPREPYLPCGQVAPQAFRRPKAEGGSGALARAPAQILFREEPFSNFDELARLDLQQMLLALWDALEAPIPLVFHSSAEVVSGVECIWICTSAPDRIARELFKEIPSFRGLSPSEAQVRPGFLRAMGEVKRIFRSAVGLFAPGSVLACTISSLVSGAWFKEGASNRQPILPGCGAVRWNEAF